jgi:hypothetical protein
MAVDHRARYDLIQWALTTKVPNSRRMGRAAMNRLLAMLALYANGDRTTYVGREVLAADLEIDEWAVWHGLKALAGAGLIATDGKQGRATRWRVRPDIPVPDEHVELREFHRNSTAVISPQSTAGISQAELRANCVQTAGISQAMSESHLALDMNKEQGNSARERAPEPRPTPNCQRHPQGTDLACASCAIARDRYTQWRKLHVCNRDGCDEPIDQSQPKFRNCTMHLRARKQGK